MKYFFLTMILAAGQPEAQAARCWSTGLWNECVRLYGAAKCAKAEESGDTSVLTASGKMRNTNDKLYSEFNTKSPNRLK